MRTARRSSRFPLLLFLSNYRVWHRSNWHRAKRNRHWSYPRNSLHRSPPHLISLYNSLLFSLSSSHTAFFTLPLSLSLRARLIPWPPARVRFALLRARLIVRVSSLYVYLYTRQCAGGEYFYSFFFKGSAWSYFNFARARYCARGASCHGLVFFGDSNFFYLSSRVAWATCAARLRLFHSLSFAPTLFFSYVLALSSALVAIVTRLSPLLYLALSLFSFPVFVSPQVKNAKQSFFLRVVNFVPHLYLVYELGLSHLLWVLDFVINCTKIKWICRFLLSSAYLVVKCFY